MVRFLAIVLMLFSLYAQEESNIHIDSSTPLEEKLKDYEVARFVNEGVIDKENIKEFQQSKNDDEDYDNKPLVSLYKKIVANDKEYKKINQQNELEDTEREFENPLLTQESNQNLTQESNQNQKTTPSRNLSSGVSDESDVPSLLENIYGHIGFFGKTNVLNKSVSGGSYGVFSGSVGLDYDFKKIVFVDIGLYGIAPIAGNNKKNILRDSELSHSAFIAHRANVKYIAKDSNYNEFFDITLGRFQERRDWIRSYAQGLQLNANYGWLQVWLDYVDEQAYANREYVTDFNIFKKAYNKEWLLAGGLGLSVLGVNVLPYYYYLNNNFWAAGTKLSVDIEFANKSWRNVTTFHYVYLNNKREFRPNEDKRSQIVWLDEMLRYRIDDKSVSFGLGYIQTMGAYFELANIGNMSRFEAYNTQGYGIMPTGGIDNGENSTNMFFANTRSFYGFLGFRIGDFAMMFLGRNSKSKNQIMPDNTKRDINQHQYSLGARYRIVEGLYLGGVGVFMLENKVNKSYAKGYIEFRI